MRIERVTPEDAKVLSDIYAPYVLHTAVSFEYDPPSVEAFRDRICAILEKYPYLKAVNDRGEILGYAYAGAFKGRKAYDYAVETTIYLRQDVRRTGIGRALYEALEDALRKMGICNMYACIAAAEGEDPFLTDASIRFHERMGFAPVGLFREVGYKFGRWYNMLWMEKQIAPHRENPLPVQFGKIE